VEWSGDKIWKMQDGTYEVFYEAEAGDGPCGIAQDADGNLWVAMYSSLKMVKLSPAGEILGTIDNYNGQPFKGPNDVVMDAKGGMYFTDSGNFEDDWLEAKPVGSVYYYSPAGELMQVDSGLVYANGIALSVDGKTLYVDEHRKNRILKYAVNDDGTLSDSVVFFEPDDEYMGDTEYAYELGTDGMWRDSQGNLWVAHYGGGKVMVISPEGNLLTKLMLPEGIYPTNTTLNADESMLYVTEGGVGLLYQIGVQMPATTPPGYYGFRRIPRQVPQVIPTRTPTK
jgi:gluconolactonase